MRVADALTGFGKIEIEAGEVARVGAVAKADVDRVGAVIDGGLQRRQAAGRADEFHKISGKLKM